MKKSITLSIALSAVYLGCVLFIVWFDAQSRQIEKRDNLERELLSLDLSLASYFLEFSETLLQDLLGKDPNDPGVSKSVARLFSGYPRSSLSIICFDVNGNIIWASPLPAHLEEKFVKQVSYPWLKKYGLQFPSTRILSDNQFPAWLGVWRSNTGTPISRNKICSLILLINKVQFPRNFVLQRRVSDLRKKGFGVGFVDRISTGSSRLPRNLSVPEIRKFCREILVWPETFKKIGSTFLTLIPIDGRTVLVGETPAVPMIVPRWCLALWIALLAISVRLKLMGGEFRYSLRAFLLFAVSLAVGIPLLLTSGICSYFEANRTKTLIREELDRMGKDLVHADNLFPTILRKNQALFSRLLRDVETKRISMKDFFSTLADLEMKCYFDNTFIIDSEGKSLRDFSHIHTRLRPLILLPKPARLRKMQDSLDMGFFPNEKELGILLAHEPYPAMIDSFWSFKNSDVTSVHKMMEALGLFFLSQQNKSAGEDLSKGRKRDAKSIMMEGMIVSESGNMVQMLQSNLGNYSKLGNSREAMQAIGDTIKNSSGFGEYAFFLVQNTLGLEMAFLRDFFSRNLSSKCQIFAESPFSAFYFPLNKPMNLLPKVRNRLSLQRPLLGEVTVIDGKRVLLSAFLCRNLENYVLFSVKPFDSIVTEQQKLKSYFWWISVLMIALVLMMIKRLQETVLLPAGAVMAGIKAMKERDFSHQINLGTGDEWDSLALTFNQTLSEMEEMEVAKVVQTKLFPKSEVVGKNTRFFGKSVMCRDVGGDYFDALVLPDGSLLFVMGDATGHGVSAALVVAMVKSAFVSLVKSGISSPALLLERIGALLFTHLKKIKLMTCQIGLLSPDGKLTFANAGHSPIYLIFPDGLWEQIALPGIPLGMRNRRGYENLLMEIRPGWRIVMYTDGFIEAENLDLEIFSQRRFEQALRDFGRASPERLISGIHQRLRDHTQGIPWEDDVTLGVVDFHRENDLPV